MRVTTQLIDAQSGADIWSMRFDRSHGDIFAIQDEIALQVTQALELALDPEAKERMTGQGTENLEAYLAFMQGRAMLATDNLSEVKAAIELFGRAVALDPKFAAAYVKLAQAGLVAAEFEMTDDRRARFEAALHRGEALVEKAIALDPEEGDAYLQRAYIRAFTDLAAAESDYRRGLELSPNSAEGHARLAGVVYESPGRREEVLELLDRARKLDPLEPRYDVLRAVFVHYVRNDVEAANAILLDVLKRHPRYTPALARLCTFRVNAMGQAATGIRYCEDALALDPLLEDTRLILIRTYAVLGDLAAADELVAASGEKESARSLAILLARHEWLRAGEVAYRSLARGTVLPMSMADHIMAVRMHARSTGDFKRAQAALGQISGVRWDASGAPVLPVDTSPVRDTAIALADVLVAGDEVAKGRRLLATIIGQMRHEIDDLHRPEFWYYAWHPVALALAGEREAAIDLLGRALANHGSVWVRPRDEPAYLPFHEDVRFQALLRSDEAYLERQRDELDRLRSEGLIPARGHQRQAASAP